MTVKLRVSPSAKARFEAAIAEFDPILRTIDRRLEGICEILDLYTNKYCLNSRLCDHLTLADDAIIRFIQAATFLGDLPIKNRVKAEKLGLHYRNVIRVLFELHPPMLELSRPVMEIRDLKKDEWEDLKFKLKLIVLELEKVLHHPSFLEHAMAVEEFVAKK